jgi:hypothetical protein
VKELLIIWLCILPGTLLIGYQTQGFLSFWQRLLTIMVIFGGGWVAGLLSQTH